METQLLKHYITAVPKAELHVHLEGSIQPATLLALAERNKVTLPIQTLQQVKEWFKFHDFNHFMDIYFTITRCLKTAEDYELIAYEFGAAMARQQIRYAEVTFSPSTHHFALGIPHDIYFNGLERGRKRANRDFGVEFRWIFDIVRSIEDPAKNRLFADYVTAVAIEGQEHGVVALGLGGAEVGYPPELFSRQFDQARAAGLHCIPHAGETVGPESVWGAVKHLRAERIGHGVRAIEDLELIYYLAEHNLPVELCPTSNIKLGIYNHFSDHPLARFYRAGVPVTVNSDDPPLFNTTLTQEIFLLTEVFKLDLHQINEILLNGIRFSCLPQSEKQALETTFQVEMLKLQEEFAL